MSDTLQEICAKKREHIAHRKTQASVRQLHEQALGATPPRGFHAALRKRIEAAEIGLIAEIKKASPSKGVIRTDFDPAALARAYHDGGATCLSVLTDMPYFQGDDRYLVAARNAVTLPVLRKDFMLDPYQVLEARALGADCILLIMAALDDESAAELESVAFDLGMDALIEVHDAAELTRALRLKSKLIGINNRSLKTLAVDLGTAEQLRPHIPEGYTVICESGIANPQDISRMRRANMHGFLVGESLMRESDVAAATRRLIEGA